MSKDRKIVVRLPRPPREELAACNEARQLAPALQKVKPLTMLPVESLVDLARLVRVVLAENVPGAFVECGAWRGGAAFLMADVLRQAGVRDREVWLLDSFEGMPPPEQIDGPAALKSTQGPDDTDNCRVSLEEVRQSALDLGLGSYTQFVKGWFEHTLPAHRQRIGPIAILRLHCVWHASVRCCLDHFYDQVVEGGFVILEDYFEFDGCATAVHEFLGERRLPHRIESVAGMAEGLGQHPTYYRCALFRKGEKTWKWSLGLYLMRQDIEALVPPGERFILVDDGWFGSEVAAGRRAFPFLERGGRYWGRPKDDATAIREMERLRQRGANFLVLAWPAFWWPDHYSEWQRYLSAKFPCLLRNDRLVVFDLRSPRRTGPRASRARRRNRLRQEPRRARATRSPA